MLRFLESISFSTFLYKRHGRTIGLSQHTEAWKIITVACIPPVVLLLAGLGGNSRLSRKNFLAAFDWTKGGTENRWRIRNLDNLDNLDNLES